MRGDHPHINARRIGKVRTALYCDPDSSLCNQLQFFPTLSSLGHLFPRKHASHPLGGASDMSCSGLSAFLGRKSLMGSSPIASKRWKAAWRNALSACSASAISSEVYINRSAI